MMGVLVYFMFMHISSATACDECVSAKVAYFANSTGLSAGACGYGSLALNFYGGHVAAALPSLYKMGAGCGACFQIRCKNSVLCSKTGTKVVLTDLHADKTNTTDFVLSSRAFRAMALPGKDRQLLQLGIMHVEYRRVPCVYKDQNLAIRVEEFSKYPNYLAIKILYQGGQTEILQAELRSLVNPLKWISMKRNYGAVFDTSKAPTGPLEFRFAVNSGLRSPRYFYTNQVLPANWKPGVIYNSTVQMDYIPLDSCTPCKPWK